MSEISNSKKIINNTVRFNERENKLNFINNITFCFAWTMACLSVLDFRLKMKLDKRPGGKKISNFINLERQKSPTVFRFRIEKLLPPIIFKKISCTNQRQTENNGFYLEKYILLPKNLLLMVEQIDN